MAQKIYSITCDGGYCRNDNKHSHPIAVSDFNNWLNNNIPSNAVISSIKYNVSVNYAYATIVVGTYADINMGLYLGSGEDNGTSLGTVGIRAKYKTSDTASHSWDVPFKSTYPFAIDTTASNLVLCFTTANIIRTDMTCTIQIVVEYETRAFFLLGQENYVYGDTAYLLDSNGNNLGAGGYLENGTNVVFHAHSFDGRKIIKYSQHSEDGTILSELTGNNLAPYLSEDGSVLNINFTINNLMVGKTYNIVITYDKVVYVTYDNCFNHYKWFHEGLQESGVTNQTSISHTFECSSTSASNLKTPLFKVEKGSYYVKFDFTSDTSNPSVYIECFVYDNNKILQDSAKVPYLASGTLLLLSIFEDGYVQFDIRNELMGSKVTYSNFIMCRDIYEYMLTSLPAYKRVQTGKWNMPTPTRDGYDFIGWNTKPDGSGITYTSNMPFPTEDLTLYSQWEITSNTYVGNRLVDVYVGNRLVDVYVGKQRV